MAIDQTAKRRNLAYKIVTNSTQLMDALTALVDLSAQYTSAGETFVDSDFNTSGLSQLDASSATAIFSSAAAVKTFVDSNFHTTNFEKARP